MKRVGREEDISYSGNVYKWTLSGHFPTYLGVCVCPCVCMHNPAGLVILSETPLSISPYCHMVKAFNPCRLCHYWNCFTQTLSLARLAPTLCLECWPIKLPSNTIWTLWLEMLRLEPVCKAGVQALNYCMGGCSPLSCPCHARGLRDYDNGPL